MTKPMNCQTAHTQLNELLDSRSAGPMTADLQAHLVECQACQSWQALFHMQPTAKSPTFELPADFSKQVLARYSREQRRMRWIRASSLFAIAASLFVAGMVWLTLTQPHQSASAGRSKIPVEEKGRKLLDEISQELDEFQVRVSQLHAPNFSLPRTITEWDLQDVNDPLAVSMPALRTVGSSLQGVLEPFETPARNTMNRVKALIDEPEVKKWVDNVKRKVM
ncbi:MAG TPA: hypothetical protein PLN21_02155 [Gemmatales bacterium]|nr:hypothetical protein [Gemmatales bacterium]